MKKSQAKVGSHYLITQQSPKWGSTIQGKTVGAGYNLAPGTVLKCIEEKRQISYWWTDWPVFEIIETSDKNLLGKEFAFSRHVGIEPSYWSEDVRERRLLMAESKLETLLKNQEDTKESLNGLQNLLDVQASSINELKAEIAYLNAFESDEEEEEWKVEQLMQAKDRDTITKILSGDIIELVNQTEIQS